LNQFSRTELLLGAEAMDKLRTRAVAIFGIGGVGSYAAEALARSGIGRIALIDDDKICLTNLNRQLIATYKTLGRLKIDVMRERILEINPDICVKVYPLFYGADTADSIDLTQYDYIIDAVDTVTAKLLLIQRAKAAGIPIISCMGTGNKLDPTKFEVADISKTSICPLARVMRKELRKRGIYHLKVVYSKEDPLTPLEDGCQVCGKDCAVLPGEARQCARRQIAGSIAFVPPVAGMILVGEVIKDLLGM